MHEPLTGAQKRIADLARAAAAERALAALIEARSAVNDYPWDEVGAGHMENAQKAITAAIAGVESADESLAMRDEGET